MTVRKGLEMTPAELRGSPGQRSLGRSCRAGTFLPVLRPAPGGRVWPSTELWGRELPNSERDIRRYPREKREPNFGGEKLPNLGAGLVPNFEADELPNFGEGPTELRGREPPNPEG